MSISLKKRPADGIPNPPPSHLVFFVDENGNPSFKDSSGVVTPATNAGAPTQYNNQPDAPAPVAGSVKVYAKDVNGVSELFALNDSGEEVQLTSGGGLPNPITMRWKDDVAGDLFDATSVEPTLADVVQVLVDPTTTLSGEGDKEGVVVSAGERVLRACALTETEDQVTNGVYIVAAGAWSRATDADTGAEIQDAIIERIISAGPPPVTERWAFWNPSGVPITVDVDAQDWVIVASDPPAVISVDAAATSEITLSGVANVVDDVALDTPGMTVLVTDQTDPVDNGVWEVAAGAWARPSGPFEEGQTWTGGIAVGINGGTLYTGTKFILNHPVSQSVTMGVDPQNWILFDTQDLPNGGPIRIDVNIDDVVAGRSPWWSVPSNGIIILTMPPITAVDAGKTITLLSYITKKAKKTASANVLIAAQPAPGDAVTPDLGAGEVAIIWAGFDPIKFISDGVGTWLMDNAFGFPMPRAVAIDLGFLPTPPGPVPA